MTETIAFAIVPVSVNHCALAAVVAKFSMNFIALLAAFALKIFLLFQPVHNDFIYCFYPLSAVISPLLILAWYS